MSLKLERKTVVAMIRLYCRRAHRRRDLCEQCRELLAYVDGQLARCPFGDAKPTCRRCPVHCYRRQMKERIMEVMRFAGPRMMLRHPVLAFRHLLREKMMLRVADRQRPGGGKVPPAGP